jgi:N-acetylneuraminate synthase/N,N'-diacetyllegionaminate synthase
MAMLDEVAEAVAALRARGNGSLILLHCVSCYPAEPGELNLRAITTLAQAFDCPAGFSDHTLGINAAIAAVALGACVIEKHLTLNRSLPGPDHCASLEPGEFRAMVLGIRDTERSLGTGEKRPVPREIEVARVVRRSVVAAVEIPAGARIDEAMLALRRPASGLPPKAWETLLGRRARRTIRAGEPITGDCVD